MGDDEDFEDDIETILEVWDCDRPIKFMDRAADNLDENMEGDIPTLDEIITEYLELMHEEYPDFWDWENGEEEALAEDLAYVFTKHEADDWTL